VVHSVTGNLFPQGHDTRQCSPTPWPPDSPDLTPLDLFLRFVKDILYHEKVQNVNVLMKCLPISGEKLSIILVCVELLMMTILRSTEHIRNFVRSSVWKCIDFSNTISG
jgi:hypothetical protein